MDAYTAFLYLMLGVILGATGQGARVIVGIKKAQQASGLKWEVWLKEGFSSRDLNLSLFIGAVAGAIASLLLMGKEVNKEFCLGLVAAGYMGADFIQGFMENKALIKTSEKEKE